ncbi:hypothetical protein MMC30_009093, partial [Trapelia coarctata]|nr:hypothetical protein [Trapelia coarctata]
MAQPSTSVARRYLLPLTALTLAGVTTYMTLTPKRAGIPPPPKAEKLESDTPLGADGQREDYAVKIHRS